MRLFAATYAVAALIAAAVAGPHGGQWAGSWVAVCGAAVVLGVAWAAGRPLVMLGAAHAGLTATWAGTIASRMFRNAGQIEAQTVAIGSLLALCAGMVLLIGAGLKAQQHAPAAAPARDR